MFPSVTRRPNRLLRDLGGSVAASAGTERGLDTNNAPVDQQVCSVTCRALPLEIGRSRGWRVCFIHDLIPSTRIDPSGGVIGRVGSRTHKATSDIQCMWRTRLSGSSTRTCFVSTTNSLAKDHLAGRICVIASTRLQDIQSSIERLSGRCCDDQLSHMTSTAEVLPLELSVTVRVRVTTWSSAVVAGAVQVASSTAGSLNVPTAGSAAHSYVAHRGPRIQTVTDRGRSRSSAGPPREVRVRRSTWLAGAGNSLTATLCPHIHSRAMSIVDPTVDAAKSAVY